MHTKKPDINFFPYDADAVIEELGGPRLLSNLRSMLLIRNFELRGEASYQQGKVGGFYHSYMGQEAIATSCVAAIGVNNWFSASYRCHGIALLLGATPREIMAEFMGRATGNAKGRGGSMHLYTDRLLGGFGIVTGQVPIATGAAFSLKYLDRKDEISVCFFGDGAVAQGSFHESLNMASLWGLPALYIIENNQWGMGTAVERAIATERLAEGFAPAYNMKGYTLNGMDFLGCYAAFKQIHREMVETGRPALVEAVTERFRGHSISDPATYRTKEELHAAMEGDPILLLKGALEEAGLLDDAGFKEIDKQTRDVVLDAVNFADGSPWPDPLTLEEDVYAEEG